MRVELEDRLLEVSRIKTKYFSRLRAYNELVLELGVPLKRLNVVAHFFIKVVAERRLSLLCGLYTNIANVEATIVAARRKNLFIALVPAHCLYLVRV